MTLHRSALHLLLAAALLASAPSAFAANKPAEETSPATNPICSYVRPLSAYLPITYTLSLTFPSSGYVVTAGAHTVSGGTLYLEVHYRLEPGVHLSVLTTHTVFFTVFPPHFPFIFTVEVNGLTLGPPANITVRPPPR
jgi:hypothetical protein